MKQLFDKAEIIAVNPDRAAKVIKGTRLALAATTLGAIALGAVAFFYRGKVAGLAEKAAAWDSGLGLAKDLSEAIMDGGVDVILPAANKVIDAASSLN